MRTPKTLCNSNHTRVVFVNRFFFPDHSATSQILADLSFALAAEGVSISVVTSRMLYDDPTALLAKSEIVRGVRVRRVWSTRLGRGNLAARAVDYATFYLAAFFALWREVDRSTILVAKTDPPLISVVAAPIAKIKGGVLVNWLQDVFPEVARNLGMRSVNGPAFSLLRWARNVSLRTARVNVVLGNLMQNVVRRECGPSSEVRVIPNWADGEAIRPISHAENPLRAAWSLENKFVVGYSGNLGRAHEFGTILAAAELLREQRHIHFLFIGSGAQRADVERQVKERGLTNLSFKPYQLRERLCESLGVADVHLVSLNPLLEGLIVPSKFYGIAAAGRPTLFIGDVTGEIAQLLRIGHCGYSIEVEDAAGLASKIRQIAGDHDLCRDLGRSARELFEQRFDRKLAIRAWKLLLAECGAARSSASG